MAKPAPESAPSKASRPLNVPGQKTKESKTDMAPKACMVLEDVIALDLRVTRRPNRSERPMSIAAPTPRIAPIMVDKDARTRLSGYAANQWVTDGAASESKT